MLDNRAAAIPADEQPSLQRLKNWIERRLMPRQETNLPVLVLHGKQVQRAILTDLSETGFGLSNVTFITVDKFISVATNDGRIFGGRVVWAQNGRAGVVITSRA